MSVSQYSPELVQAAYDIVDGNDGADWDLLFNACPDGVGIDEFIERVLGIIE